MQSVNVYMFSKLLSHINDNSDMCDFIVTDIKLDHHGVRSMNQCDIISKGYIKAYRKPDSTYCPVIPFVNIFSVLLLPEIIHGSCLYILNKL